MAGCGAALPTPALGHHPDAEYEEVPYPPPAAAPEIVPEAPDERAVWVDGQWVWRARYYLWDRGGWVIPPQGAHYAAPDRRWGRDGTLWVAEGRWRRSSDGVALEPPEVLRPAAYPPAPETPEQALSP